MSTLLDYLGVSRPQKKISWSLSSICHHFLLYNFIFPFSAVRLEVKIEGCYWIFGMGGQFDHGEINFLVQRMVLSWWYGGIYADSPRLSRNLLDTEPIPCSPVRVTKTIPDRRKLTLVAHKKTKIKAHPKWSGFLCLYYGLWLHFLVWCTLFVANRKEKVSSLLLLYKREFDWISIQPIKVPDR